MRDKEKTFKSCKKKTLCADEQRSYFLREKIEVKIQWHIFIIMDLKTTTTKLENSFPKQTYFSIMKTKKPHKHFFRPTKAETIYH